MERKCTMLNEFESRDIFNSRDVEERIVNRSTISVEKRGRADNIVYARCEVKT